MYHTAYLSIIYITLLTFFCFWSGDHRALHVLTHSFPTRRSSDLTGGNLVATRNATTTAEAGFSIGSGDWQNDLTGTATGDIVIRPTATAHFLGNVALDRKSTRLNSSH